jgi:tRNA pseudouridine65 synthase
MRLHVLHEAARWVAIAKPARLACHRSQLCHDRVTLADLASAQFKRPIHLVHRLDRATSGCLLIAFDPETVRELHATLVSPASYKSYLAFVRGYFRWDDPVTVQTPMKDSHGMLKEACSVVRPIGRSFDPWSSLVQVEPQTGRFHQVRRHLRDLAHPILRDGTHGDSRANTVWTEQEGMERLGLHCHRIVLRTEEGELGVQCPMPADLVRIWRRMPWWEEAVAVLPELAEPTLDLCAPEQLRA